MRGTEGRDRPDPHPHPRGCGFPRPLPARSSRRATSAPPSVANDSPSPAPRIPPSLQHGRGAAGLGGAFPCRQSRLLLRQPRKFVPAAPVPPPAGWRFLCSFFFPLSLSLCLFPIRFLPLPTAPSRSHFSASSPDFIPGAGAGSAAPPAGQSRAEPPPAPADGGGADRGSDGRRLPRKTTKKSCSLISV